MTNSNLLNAPSQLSNFERLLAVIPLFLMAGFGFYDFLADVKSGAPPLHLAIESFVSLLGATSGVFILRGFFRARRKLSLTRAKLASAETAIAEWQSRVKTKESEIQDWKQKSDRWVRGLAIAIDQQFQSWQLSPAEREVALLLIKGFSLKEIGEFRGTSEKTVRHQSQGVYGKSGLVGRAQLGAFFLEDLILPHSQQSQFKFDE